MILRETDLAFKSEMEKKIPYAVIQCVFTALTHQPLESPAKPTTTSKEWEDNCTHLNTTGDFVRGREADVFSVLFSVFTTVTFGER